MSELYAVNRESRIRFVAKNRGNSEVRLRFGDVPVDGARHLAELGTLTPHFPPGSKEPECHVVLLQSVYSKTVDHLASDTSREHGGILLGYETTMEDNQSSRPAVVIVDAVAAKFTEGSPVRLNFTTQSWQEIDEEIARRYGDRENAPQRVGWYHSHPKIQIFLSRWDLDVCTTFASRRYPVALVVDPVDHHGGFFIGGTNGYDPHCPLGFFEAHDVMRNKSVVEWTNLGKPALPLVADDTPYLATVEEPPPPPSEPRVNKDEAKKEPDRNGGIAQPIYPIISGAVMFILATVVVYLWLQLRVVNQKLEEAQNRIKAGTTPLPSQEPPVSKKLEVHPNETEVYSSGTVKFTTTASGIDNPGVKWSVKTLTGQYDEKRDGKIDPDGLYHAPATIKKDEKVDVTASIENTSFFSTATLHLKSNFAYSIRPNAAKLQAGKSIDFRLVAKGGTPNPTPAVTWQIDPSIGSMSSNGHYVAPTPIDADQQINVKATAGNQSELAHATIQLQKGSADASDVSKNSSGEISGSWTGTDDVKVDSPLSQTPANAALELGCDSSKKLNPGDTTRFSPKVGGKTAEVIWRVEPAGLGSVSAEGDFKAPDPILEDTNKVTITATTKADPKLTSSCTLTLVPKTTGRNE
jgi:proteasome lid subunit RPN8/RPN11